MEQPPADSTGVQHVIVIDGLTYTMEELWRSAGGAHVSPVFQGFMP